MGADEFSGLSDDQSAPAFRILFLATIVVPQGVLLPQLLLMELELILRQQNLFIIKIDRCPSLTGWKFEASNTTSPFIFTMDYSLIGGVTTGTTIQYFIVAQDVFATPLVGINSVLLLLLPVSL
jgi:hypothetical protein